MRLEKGKVCGCNMINGITESDKLIICIILIVFLTIVWAILINVTNKLLGIDIVSKTKTKKSETKSKKNELLLIKKNTKKKEKEKIKAEKKAAKKIKKENKKAAKLEAKKLKKEAKEKKRIEIEKQKEKVDNGELQKSVHVRRNG